MNLLRFCLCGVALSAASNVASASLGLPDQLLVPPGTPEAFPLVDSGKAASLWVDPADYAGVQRAAADLQNDVQRVTGVKPALTTTSAPGPLILVGTLGKSPLIDSLVKAGKLDAAPISGKWESFVIATVSNPLPNVDKALVIAGSDKRGTIYGIYEISEQIGVSPWYWWADVPTRHRDELHLRHGNFVQGPPAVKYRGIFLNDENPCLGGWVQEKFGGYTSKFYAHVFELLLRLRGNYLWPAMWSSAFNEDDPENPRLADEYGIVMGTSHHEPMLRSQQEWKRHGTGPWNYVTNQAPLDAFWQEGVERNKNFESIVTVGMRGDGDKPMIEGGDMDANVKVLENVVDDQRGMIAKAHGTDASDVPQLWALYKEVLDYYSHGMRVPDDITLLWCDDNYGNIRRLPTPEERGRSGGAGVYYHLDYYGYPRSYKWLNTCPLPKIWEQMNLGYRYGADRIWILNVGDLKPMEIPMEFFLRMAWDPDALPKEKISDYTRRWAEREFGPEHAPEIADVVARYAKYNAWRKPEMLEPGTFSFTNYREAERVSGAWQELSTESERLSALLPADSRDAFYQLVLYPTKASATVAELYLAAGRNQLFAAQGRASANSEADRARKLFQQDQDLSNFYNHEMAGGKWDHMMDQTHIGYTSWKDPQQNEMPKVTEIPLTDTASLGVAIDGSAEAWPGASEEGQLPAFDSLNRQRSYLDVFARGTRPIHFTATADQPWIATTVEKQEGRPDSRIWVSIDWDKAPTGSSSGTITVLGEGASVAVKVEAIKASDEEARNAQGAFGGMAGPISMAAGDAVGNKAVDGVRWEPIPDYGRAAAGMSIFPVNAASILPPKPSPCLEYPVFLPRAGTIQVDAIIGATLDFVPGRGLRAAFSFDDQSPQIVDDFAQPEPSPNWSKVVKDNVRVLSSTHSVATPGRHTLKVWMVDPGVVLEKLVLSSARLPSSYFGPPEGALNGTSIEGEEIRVRAAGRDRRP